jgi:hypothetical protein
MSRNGVGPRVIDPTNASATDTIASSGTHRITSRTVIGRASQGLADRIYDGRPDPVGERLSSVPASAQHCLHGISARSKAARKGGAHGPCPNDGH